MKTLIAIGGGSFQKQETRAIDMYAIARCGKSKPRVLFLPLASRDDQGYAKRFKQYYRTLGCEVQALRLLHTKLHIEEIYDTFRRQDIIYLGAGDTTFLMEQLQLRSWICCCMSWLIWELLYADSAPEQMCYLNMATVILQRIVMIS